MHKSGQFQSFHGCWTEVGRVNWRRVRLIPISDPEIGSKLAERIALETRKRESESERERANSSRERNEPKEESKSKRERESERDWQFPVENYGHAVILATWPLCTCVQVGRFWAPWTRNSVVKVLHLLLRIWQLVTNPSTLSPMSVLHHFLADFFLSFLDLQSQLIYLTFLRMPIYFPPYLVPLD